MEQKEVGNVPQAGQRLAVAERNGLAARVAGGHDERRERRERGKSFEEQAVSYTHLVRMGRQMCFGKENERDRHEKGWYHPLSAN